jgi:hypothetical protein
MAVASWLLQVS